MIKQVERSYVETAPLSTFQGSGRIPVAADRTLFACAGMAAQRSGHPVTIPFFNSLLAAAILKQVRHALKCRRQMNPAYKERHNRERPRIL